MIMQRAPENDAVMTSLAAARRLVRDLQPYSPAWDAAMAWVDDLEREAGNKWATVGTAEPVTTDGHLLAGISRALVPAPGPPRRGHPRAWHHLAMPPIDELTRIEPVLLSRLDRMGIFTTGLLLEVSETPTRRQTLADQMATDTTDVLAWRDEALMLNLASFGPDEHQLMIQAGIEGLKDILDLELDAFGERVRRAADELGMDPPSDLTLEGWWDQARTLEDE